MSRGYKALQAIETYDKEELVSVLERGGFDVNHVDSWGYTLLHRAAERGRVGCVEVIVEARDNRGYSALHRAIMKSASILYVESRRKYIKTIEVLLYEREKEKEKKGR